MHRRLVAGPCTSYVAIGRPIPSSAYTRSNWYPLTTLPFFFSCASSPNPADRLFQLEKQEIKVSSKLTRDEWRRALAALPHHRRRASSWINNEAIIWGKSEMLDNIFFFVHSTGGVCARNQYSYYPRRARSNVDCADIVSSHWVIVWKQKKKTAANNNDLITRCVTRPSLWLDKPETIGIRQR